MAGSNRAPPDHPETRATAPNPAAHPKRAGFDASEIRDRLPLIHIKGGLLMQTPDSPISRERRRVAEVAGNDRIKTGLKFALLAALLLFWIPLTMLIFWLKD